MATKTPKHFAVLIETESGDPVVRVFTRHRRARRYAAKVLRAWIKDHFHDHPDDDVGELRRYARDDFDGLAALWQELSAEGHDWVNIVPCKVK